MSKRRTWRRLVTLVAVAAACLFVVPTAGAQQTITETVQPGEFPRVGELHLQHLGGDREFAAHGPHVVAHVFLNGVIPGGTTLAIEVCMDARETKADWTYGAACGPRDQIYQTPPGFCMQSVDVQTMDRLDYTDTDISYDFFGDTGPGSLVWTWMVMGDSSWETDIPRRTGIRVETRRIHVTSAPC